MGPLRACRASPSRAAVVFPPARDSCFAATRANRTVLAIAGCSFPHWLLSPGRPSRRRASQLSWASDRPGRRAIGNKTAHRNIVTAPCLPHVGTGGPLRTELLARVHQRV